MSSINKEIRIFCIDIETSGQKFIANEILAIGICIGDTSGNIEKTVRILIRPTKKFDDLCYSDFWIKHLDMLENIETNGIDAKEGIQNFVDILDAYDSKYDVKIISDNPSFDLGFINYYLEFYLNRKPINFILGKNIYRHVYDTRSYSRGLIKLNYDQSYVSDYKLRKIFNVKIKSKYTHYPDDDASVIYETHIRLINAAIPPRLSKLLNTPNTPSIMRSQNTPNKYNNIF